MSDEQDIIKERMQNLAGFAKKNSKWLTYLPILPILLLASILRIQNLHLLKDVVTGKYIPLALDPHVFLRYAQYIAEHGALFMNDPMRNVPLGLNLESFAGLQSFIIAEVYEILHIFIPGITINFVHIIYPVVAFGIMLIFFYLVVKRLFDWKIATVASLFLSILPTFLYRSMAGFADHDILTMMFWFITFYVFVVGWQSKKYWVAAITGLLSGIVTGLHALSGGNVKFVLIIIGGFALVELFLDKFEKKDLLQFVLWVLPAYYMMAFMTAKYGGAFGLARSFTSSIALLAFGVGIIHFFVFKIDIFKQKKKLANYLPKGVTSFIITGVLGVLGIIVTAGPSFLWRQVQHVYVELMYSFGKTRWHLTVAENHQPYFTSWIAQLNWIYVLLFMVGSIILFYQMLKPLSSKLRYRSTVIYTIFIIGFTMSRYSRGSFFNGETLISQIVYIGSLIAFLLYLAIGYLYAFFKDKKNFDAIKSIEKRYIFMFIWFLLMVVAARSASRLFFEFSPITTILSAMLVFYAINQQFKKEQLPYIAGGVAIIGIVYGIVNWRFLAYSFTGIFFLTLLLIIVLVVAIIPHIMGKKAINKKLFIIAIIFFVMMVSLPFLATSFQQASYTGPSYNEQWQHAMDWVREETPENSTFIHWWDYGYWVQSQGERATVTDGGNNIVLWNHFIGRHLLTAQNATEALQLTKTYGADYLLILQDEIGKYTAYSTIGADENYDRYSWITTFQMDPTKTVETRNQTVYAYMGGYMLDEDLVYENKVYPAEKAGIGAIFLPVSTTKISMGNQSYTTQQYDQPKAAVFYNNQRVDVPLKCLYIDGQYMEFEGAGLDGCLRVMPSVGQTQYNKMGGALYLSGKVSRALMANLYLMNQQNPKWNTTAFELAHEEQHPRIKQLNSQYDLNIDDLALVGGNVLGPIKIWKIDEPESIQKKPIYLETSFEDANLTSVQEVGDRG